MQGKKMVKHFLTLLFIASLTACASLHVSRQDETNLVGNDKNIFVDSSIARFMGTADRVKLQNLVATAQPEQLINWYSSTGVRFEFTSKRIFVNAMGEGCRDYQIKMNRGFFEHRAFNYTACRGSQGVWLVTSSR
ncbi:MAG: hypothetical protein V4471_07540 [Pseudomonadota bacterium]